MPGFGNLIRRLTERLGQTLSLRNRSTPTREELDALLAVRPFREFSYDGYCPCCERKVVFTIIGPYLRDTLLCANCGCIPRERALAEVFGIAALDMECKLIHESSPVDRGFSCLLQKRYGNNYLRSQYWPELQAGELRGKFRNENLEALSFADDSISVHVSQDVFEHLFNPEQAVHELYRTLRPGGMHIFTTPLIAGDQPTRCRAKLEAGQVLHLEEPPEYHGNPISENGSLVTYHYGYDLASWIDRCSGFKTEIFSITDISKGIIADLNEVLVSRKPEQPHS